MVNDFEPLAGLGAQRASPWPRIDGGEKRALLGFHALDHAQLAGITLRGIGLQGRTVVLVASAAMVGALAISDRVRTTARLRRART